MEFGGFGVNNNAVVVSEISLSTIFLVGFFLLICFLFRLISNGSLEEKGYNETYSSIIL